MASSLKHPGDVENHVSSKSAGEPRLDQLNADAVSLDVPVKVHGSRIVDASKGALPQTEPFEELTATMIVFPQGGVLRMASTVTPGQMLVLTNMKSNQDAICRVLKVRTYSNQASYVEFQFTHAQPNYWGVQFGASSLPAAAPVSPAPISAVPDLSAQPKRSVAQPVANGSAAKIADVPAVAIAPPVAPASQQAALPVAKNAAESSFIGIESREEVEPAATATTKAPKLSVVRKPAPAAVVVPAASAVPAAPKADVPQASVSAPATPEPSGAALQEPVADPQPAFGANLRERSETAYEDKQPVWLNWKLAGAAAALAVAIGGGFFLTHSRSENSVAPSASNASAPASAAQTGQPAAVATAPANPSGVEATAKKVANSASATGLTTLARTSPAAKAPSVPVQDRIAESRPETPSQPAHRVPDVTSDLFGSLNAHPVAGASHSAAAAVSAPAPDANTIAPTSGPIAGLNAQAPAPPPLPSTEAGSAMPKKVSDPQLISSVQPIYPDTARALHAQGDVTVQATIDTRGKVIEAKAISGPFILRQSAESAIRQWKYQPGLIDGKPSNSQTLVVVRFR